MSSSKFIIRTKDSGLTGSAVHKREKKKKLPDSGHLQFSYPKRYKRISATAHLLNFQGPIKSDEEHQTNYEASLKTLNLLANHNRRNLLEHNSRRPKRTPTQPPLAKNSWKSNLDNKETGNSTIFGPGHRSRERCTTNAEKFILSVEEYSTLKRHLETAEWVNVLYESFRSLWKY